MRKVPTIGQIRAFVHAKDEGEALFVWDAVGSLSFWETDAAEYLLGVWDQDAHDRLVDYGVSFVQAAVELTESKEWSPDPDAPIEADVEWANRCAAHARAYVEALPYGEVEANETHGVNWITAQRALASAEDATINPGVRAENAVSAVYHATPYEPGTPRKTHADDLALRAEHTWQRTERIRVHVEFALDERINTRIHPARRPVRRSRTART